MIVDFISLFLSAGRGGDGCSSFVRKRNRLVGDGGEGGRGGDIILEADRNLYDLSKFKYKRKFKAQDGERGKAHRKKGKDAPDLLIPVPCGTIVKDREGRIIADLKEDKQRICLARGGRGGKGNFKREEAEKGERGEEKEIILDYRILADIAIIGFANSGKTSLFNILTHKNFKVAPYPFTTTSCAWATFQINFRRFTILDTPPLRKEKKNDFLKHLLRVKLVLVVLDDFFKIEEDIKMIKKIVENFDVSYRNKNFFYLLNKIDKIDKSFKKKKKILYISAKTGEGINSLIEKIKKFFL